ncbi:GumC family protein [Candidatus Omnitrophota bacterium]
MERVALKLTNYWLILCKRKKVFALSLLAVFVSVVIYSRLQVPVYRAVCSIKLVGDKSVVDMITSTDPYIPYSLMSSISNSLTNSSIIERAVYGIGLADKDTPAKDLERAILSIQNATKAEIEPSTNIIHIKVRHIDASMAAKIANSIAKVFMQADIEEKNERAQNNRLFIEEQVASAKQKLTQAEKDLEVFEEQEKETTGIATAIGNNIATLEQQRIEILEIQLIDHSDVIKINEQIEDLKGELESLSRNEIELTRLIREYEANERLYRILQSRLEDVRFAEEAEEGDLKVASPAKVPEIPLEPNTNLAITIGLISGILFGIFMVFATETFKL